MATLNLKHLQKVYPGGILAVEDFNMDIQDGEFIVLVGPSGCGKSTTLRMIAGLEGITNGRLLIDSKDVTYKASKDRDIAMVFQNYALYANMTIYQNMAFSLMLRKEKPEIIHEKVIAASKMLSLFEQLNKKPKALSGGQRQRVAMGRAIVRNPKVFLFDEPLSNLDAKLRSSMRREIKLLHHKLGATMIYVTHDQTEALTLADRIVVMSMGRVQQIGTPVNVYDDPNNMFVASFIGTPPTNFFHGKIEKGEFVMDDKIRIKLTQGELNMLGGKTDVILGVRPEHLSNFEKVTAKSIKQDGKKFHTIFEVDLVEHLGSYSLLHGKIGDTKCVFKIKGWTDIDSNDVLSIQFNTNNIYFFDPENGSRLRGE